MIQITVSRKEGVMSWHAGCEGSVARQTMEHSQKITSDIVGKLNELSSELHKDGVSLGDYTITVSHKVR